MESFQHWRIFLIVFAVKLLNFQIHASRNFKIILHSAVQNIHDPEYIKTVELDLRPYNGQRAIHFEFELNKPVESFDLRLSIHTPRQKQPLADLSAAGCDVLMSQNEQIQLVKLIAQRLLTESKLPKKCPLPANERFIIERFYLLPDDFPPITPEFNSFANLSFLVKKKTLFSVKVNYEFKRK